MAIFFSVVVFINVNWVGKVSREKASSGQGQ